MHESLDSDMFRIVFLIFTGESKVFNLIIRENDEVKTVLDYGVYILFSGSC